jgi:hypothetical protein
VNDNNIHQRPPPVTGHYEAYASFARLLRAWLVAYGIGVPVLIFSHDKVTEVLAKSQQGQNIVMLFLIGVCLQVAGAMLFKTTEWYLFVGEVDSGFLTCWRYRIAEWISNQFWIELLLDIGTIGLFVSGTYKALFIIAG